MCKTLHHKSLPDITPDITMSHFTGKLQIYNGSAFIGALLNVRHVPS